MIYRCADADVCLMARLMETVVDGSTPNIWQLQANEDIPGLINALGDFDPGIRKRAAAALRILDAAQALPALKEALEIEDDWQAQASLTAAVQFLSRGDRLLDLITQQNADGLLAVLLSGNEAEVIGAVRALGQISDQRAVEPLISLFQAETTSDDVRYVVAEALIELKSAPTIVSLVAGLRRDEWQIRRNSAAILGQLKATWAAPALADALRDTNSLVRRTAEAALRQLDTPAAREALVEWHKLQAAAQQAAASASILPEQESPPSSEPQQDAALPQPDDEDDDASWVEDIAPVDSQPPIEEDGDPQPAQTNPLPSKDTSEDSIKKEAPQTEVPIGEGGSSLPIQNKDASPVVMTAPDDDSTQDTPQADDDSDSWVETVDLSVSETPVLEFEPPELLYISEEPESAAPQIGHDSPTIMSRATELRRPANFSAAQPDEPTQPTAE